MFRRTSIDHSVFSLLFCCVLLGIGCEASEIKGLLFGSPQSEEAFSLTTENSIIESGLDGQTCRRINPDGVLSWTAACDPDAQNYLTIRLSGSDTGDGQLYLYNGDQRVGARFSDLPELDIITDTPANPGGWIYRTYSIPRIMTDGKTAFVLAIRSAGLSTPYNRNGREQLQANPSRGIYAAWVHTEPKLEFPPHVNVASAATTPFASGVLPSHQVIEQVNRAVDLLLRTQVFGPVWEYRIKEGTAPEFVRGSFAGSQGINEDSDWKRRAGNLGSNAVSLLSLEVFGLAYHAEYSPYFQDSSMVERVLAGLDFLVLAQGNDGGLLSRKSSWIGAPDRQMATNVLEGFGDMGPPRAWLLLANTELAQAALDQPVDDDLTQSTPEVTRRQAYLNFFRANRDYLSEIRRGHAPNQEIANITAAWLDNEAMESLQEGSGWSETEKEEYLNRAFGFSPGIYKEDAYWISEAGLSCEGCGIIAGGYCGNYGEHPFEMLTRLASFSSDERYALRLRQMLEAYAFFRLPGVDASGSLTWQVEGAISWRNNSLPGKTSFGIFPQAAAEFGIPVALRQFELARNYGYFDRLVLSPNVHFSWETVVWMRSIPYIQTLEGVAPSDIRLPMEESQPDFVFYDLDAANVVIRKGDQRIAVALNWRHGFDPPRLRRYKTAVVNNVARIHETGPFGQTVATVAMESPHGFRKLYTCHYGNWFFALNLCDKNQFPVDIPANWRSSPSIQWLEGGETDDNGQLVLPARSAAIGFLVEEMKTIKQIQSD